MNQIPTYIYKVAEVLVENGYEAYLVGGSLRDILLNREPKDFDIATNALPEDTTRIFPKSIPTGAKFGMVMVIVEDEHGLTNEVEVTTYRNEKDYVGGRWPSHVEFSKNIKEDLKRRDFTINAMALELNSQLSIENFQLNLLDLFNGQKDLENKIIRAVGDPIERFREDGLRGMRACRLASVLGFGIEEATLNGIKETLEVAALVSKERIQSELIKLIEDSPKPSVGLELMRKCGLLELYIPELLEGYGMEHNHYHVHDIYQHALDTVDIAPKEIRFAALFHDIGKPRSKDGETFYGHDRVGAQMTKDILKRLKFSNEFVEKNVRLVREHMFFYPHKDEIHESEQKEVRDQAFKDGWSDAAIRRLIQRVGGHDNLDNLIKLRIADASANPKSSFNPNREGLRALIERVASIREQESLLSVKDLQITGDDLIELGIPKGPKIKEVLEYLLHEVTEDIELNEKGKLLDLSRNYSKA